jgi:DNA-damage-inducible protein J
MTSNTTNLNIRIDKDLKKQAETFFGELGLNMTTAINIFVRQSLRQGKIPFEITSDPFYSISNMKALERSLQQLKDGKVVTKTIEELEQMTNE